MGGGGQKDRTGKSKINEEIQYHRSNKSKIIDGVAVSGQDAPLPPLPSTTRSTGRVVRYQVPETSDRIRGIQTSIGRGLPVKVHFNNMVGELNVEQSRRAAARGREYTRGK